MIKQQGGYLHLRLSPNDYQFPQQPSHLNGETQKKILQILANELKASDEPKNPQIELAKKTFNYMQDLMSSLITQYLLSQAYSLFQQKVIPPVMGEIKQNKIISAAIGSLAVSAMIAKL